VQAAPAEVGIALANWNWKAVRHFAEARCGMRLCRSACTRSLHRLGFASKRPKKRLLKADEAKRATFVQEYVALLAEARAAGAKIFFADEAHFRADADLHGKWVLKGKPALVDSTCPRWGEQASYYSAVCLETGEVEQMELTGTSSSATRNCLIKGQRTACCRTPHRLRQYGRGKTTSDAARRRPYHPRATLYQTVSSAAFLKRVRASHTGPLIVIWDNGPAHGGAAVRDDLATPELHLRLVRLPAYSPDCNPDEAIRAWVREEVTANTCLGSKAAVQEQVQRFFASLPARVAEVQSRCRRTLQSLAEALTAPVPESNHELLPVDPIGASV